MWRSTGGKRFEAVSIIVDQRRYDKCAPGSAWGGACGYNLSHDQLSSIDQQNTNCDLTKLGLGKRDIAGIRTRYL